MLSRRTSEPTRPRDAVTRMGRAKLIADPHASGIVCEGLRTVSSIAASPEVRISIDA